MQKNKAIWLSRHQIAFINEWSPVSLHNLLFYWFFMFLSYGSLPFNGISSFSLSAYWIIPIPLDCPPDIYFWLFVSFFFSSFVIFIVLLFSFYVKYFFNIFIYYFYLLTSFFMPIIVWIFSHFKAAIRIGRMSQLWSTWQKRGCEINP